MQTDAVAYSPPITDRIKSCIQYVGSFVCLSVLPMPTIYGKSKSHRNFQFGGDILWGLTLDSELYHED